KEAELAGAAARMAIRDRFAEFMKAHRDYPWPGNVRELHAVVRTLALGLPPRTHQITKSREHMASVPREIANGSGTLDTAVRWYCRRVLDKNGRKQGQTAEVLGIDRGTLRKYLGRDGDEA